MEKQKEVRRGFLSEAIANGCGFEQNDPNDRDQIEFNVLVQGFSPDYMPIKNKGERIGTKIVNDYRIAIFNRDVRMKSNYQVFKDMETLEKNIAITNLTRIKKV